MRLAAIDIGTNSVHMIVVRVRPDFSFEVIDREKEMVRLGAGGLDGRKLTREAQVAALQALSKFERIARSHQVDEILAAATSATREAENGGAFLAAIAEQTGIRAQVITGTDEARLIHLAAVYGVDTQKPAVVIDIGGGSVEITLGSGGDVHFARSFKMGVIRMTERFVNSDPLQKRDERKLVRYIGEQTDRYLGYVVREGFDRVIGTSGTVLSLGTVATAVERGSVPGEVRNLRVPARSLRRLRKTATSMTLDERLALPGLDARRGDLMVAGSILLDTLLKKLGASEITLCDLALREGMVIDYIQRHRRKIARVDRYPDVRRRSVIELGERCRWDPEHARQVARLALAILDQTAERHGLGDREKEWLEYAALLHDIGHHISFEKHHRHSYYLIKHGDLRGFEPEEIETIALIARYHRRATPKRSHEGYATLDSGLRRTVRVLSACLRMAESLDRSRHGAVGELTIRTRGEDLRLQVATDGDVELEIWAANRQAPILAEALGRPVTIARVPSPAGGAGAARQSGRARPARKTRAATPRARVTRN